MLPTMVVAKTPTLKGGAKSRAKVLVAEAMEHERNGRLRSALRVRAVTLITCATNSTTTTPSTTTSSTIATNCQRQ